MGATRDAVTVFKGLTQMRPQRVATPHNVTVLPYAGETILPPGALYAGDSLIRVLFAIDLVALFLMLAGIVWSVVRPSRRIWPPPGGALLAIYRDLGLLLCGLRTQRVPAVPGLETPGFFAGNLRFLLGIPLALLGGLLAIWGVATIGLNNSSGLRGGFVASGPYRFTCNPQYLGDSVLFLGLSIIANSELLWVTHALLALVFIITPLSEEVWLKEQYGEEYERYRRDTPRFL